MRPLQPGKEYTWSFTLVKGKGTYVAELMISVVGKRFIPPAGTEPLVLLYLFGALSKNTNYFDSRLAQSDGTNALPFLQFSLT